MTTNPEINRSLQEYSKKIIVHRGTEIMQRLSLYCINKTGQKISDYIRNGATDDEKLALLNELNAILDKQEWDKLPKVPQGQATPTNAPAPAPKPEPKPEPKAELPPIEEPEPTPAPVQAPVAVAAPTPAAADPAQQLAALLGQLMQPKPATPTITEAEVRKMVRAELAKVFSTIAGVLSK